MADVTITWDRKWRERPLRSPSECSHPGDAVLTINQRLEPGKRGGHQMAADGAICMDCGDDGLGRMGLVEGLEACMDEHGWDRETGLRLYDIVEARKDEVIKAPLVPIWFGHALGLDGATIARALAATWADEVQSC